MQAILIQDTFFLPGLIPLILGMLRDPRCISGLLNGTFIDDSHA